MVVLMVRALMSAEDMPFGLAPATPPAEFKEILLDIHAKLSASLIRVGEVDLDILRLRCKETVHNLRKTDATDFLAVANALLLAIEAAQTGRETDAVALLPDLKARIEALSE